MMQNLSQQQKRLLPDAFESNYAFGRPSVSIGSSVLVGEDADPIRAGISHYLSVRSLPYGLKTIFVLQARELLRIMLLKAFWANGVTEIDF